jgi:RHS repeat-associated protein
VKYLDDSDPIHVRKLEVEQKAFAYKFTGKERDAESGLDNFGGRYYGSSMGRFMSLDPSGLMYADPTNPQSLNLYSYALYNPLIMIDPTGLTSCFYGGAGDTPENDSHTTDYEDIGTDQQCIYNGGKVLSEDASVDVNADYSGSEGHHYQRLYICRDRPASNHGWKKN